MPTATGRRLLAAYVWRVFRRWAVALYYFIVCPMHCMALDRYRITCDCLCVCLFALPLVHESDRVLSTCSGAGSKL